MGQLGGNGREVGPARVRGNDRRSHRRRFAHPGARAAVHRPASCSTRRCGTTTTAVTTTQAVALSVGTSNDDAGGVVRPGRARTGARRRRRAPARAAARHRPLAGATGVGGAGRRAPATACSRSRSPCSPCSPVCWCCSGSSVASGSTGDARGPSPRGIAVLGAAIGTRGVRHRLDRAARPRVRRTRHPGVDDHDDHRTAARDRRVVTRPRAIRRSRRCPAPRRWRRIRR